MRFKCKKTFQMGKDFKLKIAKDSGVTIIAKYKNGHISINKKALIIYGENGVIKKQKQLWIFKKKKLNIKEIKVYNINKRIKSRNKKNIIKQIVEHNKEIKNGIKMYRLSRRCFWCFILLAMLLGKNLFMALGCIMLAIYFSIKAFELIKYKKIDYIIKEMGKGLSFINLYSEEKIKKLIIDFGNEYGENIDEYLKLNIIFNDCKNIEKRIKKDFKNIEIEDVSYYLKIQENKKNNMNKEKKVHNKKNKDLEQDRKLNVVNNKMINYTSLFEDKPCNNSAVLSRKEEKNSEGIKSINRVMDFFDGIECSDKKDNAIISKDNNKLTVYFYKKSSVL